MSVSEAGNDTAGRSFENRFRSCWIASLERWTADMASLRAVRPVFVACSGGLDSLVLLHLLRFQVMQQEAPGDDREPGAADADGPVPPARRLAVAHFDHRMRPGSELDGRWLEGLAGAWQLPIIIGRSRTLPANEEEARDERYRFLDGLIEEEQASFVVTAHHADDQVETILFRILRGTGIQGLEGIPEVRPPGIARPLLPFSRSELEAYAARHRIRPRIDPTNASLRFARNRLRSRLIPVLEEVHPGARAGLLRLRENARDAGEALVLLAGAKLSALSRRDSEGRLVLDRDRLLEEPRAVQQEVLRSALRQVGIAPSRSGTAAVMQFIREGSSGREIRLSGGARVARDFDEIRISRSADTRSADTAGRIGGSGRQDGFLTVTGPGPGKGAFHLGGLEFRAQWCTVEAPPDRTSMEEDETWVAELDPSVLEFPLTMRGREPGDRVLTSGGHRKLKKVLAELRVPSGDRARTPILLDARNRLVWIPGHHGPAEWTAGGPKGDAPVPIFRLEVSREPLA
jgi:tRNA(Ile)-lysidine synthase